MGTSIAVDHNNHVFIAGAFSGSVNFNPTGSPDVHNSHGGVDIFITKYDVNGSYLQTQTIGGTWDDSPKKMILDPYGSPIITGTFFSPTMYLGNAAILTFPASLPLGNQCAFMTKLNGNLIHVWSLAYGHALVQDAAMDGNQNIISVGSFSGNGNNPTDFDPNAGQQLRYSNGWADGYVLKLG